MGLGRLIGDVRSCRFDRRQWDGTDIGKDYTEGWKRVLAVGLM